MDSGTLRQVFLLFYIFVHFLVGNSDGQHRNLQQQNAFGRLPGLLGKSPIPNSDVGSRKAFNLREQFGILESLEDIKDERGCIPFISDLIRVFWDDCRTKADSLAWSTWGTQITSALKGGQLDFLSASKETCKLQADKENCQALGRHIRTCDILGTIKTVSDIQSAKQRCDNLNNIATSLGETFIGTDKGKEILGVKKDTQPDLLGLIGAGIPWAAKALSNSAASGNSGALGSSSSNLLGLLSPGASGAGPGPVIGGSNGGLLGGLTGGNGGGGLLSGLQLPSFGTGSAGSSDLLGILSGGAARGAGGGGASGILENVGSFITKELTGNFIRNILARFR